MKSETCLGKVSGKPLSSYYTEFEAQSAAEYAKNVYDDELAPYKCQRCDYWHLSPKCRMTPSQKCSRCTSAIGEYKNSYPRSKEARLRASIIYDEKGIELEVYKCRYGNGWHLTKTRNY